MNRDKIIFALIIICVLFVLSGIVLEIWAIITYGGKPIEEIPTWLLWLLMR